MTSDNLGKRILATLPIFLVLFFSITILSYYILPEGLLSSKNQAFNFETSQSIIMSAFQILAFNMLSVGIILFASLFSKRKDEHSAYLSYGYLGFFLLVGMNAVTLGTWSFAVNHESVTLGVRLLQIFCVWKNAGLLEMLGQMFITCAFAKSYLIMTTGKTTVSRKFKELVISKYEIIAAICGVILMLVGAFVESSTIIYGSL